MLAKKYLPYYYYKRKRHFGKVSIKNIFKKLRRGQKKKAATTP